MEGEATLASTANWPRGAFPLLSYLLIGVLAIVIPQFDLHRDPIGDLDIDRGKDLRDDIGKNWGSPCARVFSIMP